MTIEELKQLFAIQAKNKGVLKENMIHGGDPKLKALRYMVYSYRAREELIKKMKAYQTNGDPFDDDSFPYCARYVIEQSGALLLALEGRPGSSIPRLRGSSRENNRGEVVPAHTNMTNKKCIAAGNIEFSSDYRLIKKITNQSHHFTPHPGTIVWAIAALCHVGACFADEVLLGCWKKSASQQLIYEEILLPKEKLMELVPKEVAFSVAAQFEIGVYSEDTWQWFDETTEPRMMNPSSSRNSCSSGFSPSASATTYGGTNQFRKTDSLTPEKALSLSGFFGAVSSTSVLGVHGLSPDKSCQQKTKRNKVSHERLAPLLSLGNEFKSENNTTKRGYSTPPSSAFVSSGGLFSDASSEEVTCDVLPMSTLT